MANKVAECTQHDHTTLENSLKSQKLYHNTGFNTPTATILKLWQIQLANLDSEVSMGSQATPQPPVETVHLKELIACCSNQKPLR